MKKMSNNDGMKREEKRKEKERNERKTEKYT